MQELLTVGGGWDGRARGEVLLDINFSLQMAGDATEDPKVLFKRSLRALRPDQMTEEMIKDINAANLMFDQADKEVQRVYL